MMMLRITYNATDGKILSAAFFGPDVEARVEPITPNTAHIQIEAFAVPDIHKHHVTQGKLLPRVPVTALSQFTATTFNEITIPDLPEGTSVYVDGDLVGVIDHTNELALSFADPGVWPVRLEPPFPWLPSDIEVTVT